MLICAYCSKHVKNLNAKAQHEIRCKENSNKIIVVPSYGMLGKKGKNQYSYGKHMSDETKKKISEKSKQQKWSPERREAHSSRMKEVVALYPESYTSSNRGRTKQIVHDGIKFQGKWELCFYLYCKDNNIEIVRCNEWFEYEWNGTRKYFPDFYLPQKDLYIEVKGYETDRDRAKWKTFPKSLRVIKKLEIEQIKKGCFGGL